MPIPQITYKTNKNYQAPPKKRTPYNGYRRKKSWKLSLFLFFLKLAFWGVIIGALCFAGLLLWVSKDLPSANKLIERDIALSTKIYDRTGETVLYDIHGEEKRTMVDLENIPEYAKKASITAEDRQFYEHHGFNLKGIIRAVIKNLFHGDLYGQGGSTITQQLVKNAILGQQKTYARKLRELVLSYRIETKYSKDDILKMYLNEIPYGSTIYGIEAASQSFFGISAKNLNLAQAATLAAIVKAPTYYSPYGNHKDKLVERQQYILDSMVEENYITKDEAEAAKKEELKFKPLNESIIAPHFVMYIKELLAEKYGEKFLEQGGLKVYTTLDLDKQKKAEEAVRAGVEKAQKNYNATNGALVAIDPKNGQILAMVGSRDYFDTESDGNFNVALAGRQPGSSFKPIVYTALLQKGYTPETVLFDAVTNFKPKNVVGKDYIPHNYNGKEYGPISIRKALAGSLNTPAVKALYLAGLDNVLELAKTMGYTTLGDKDRFGLSLVLGGGEVKLLEHTAAYGILARDGLYHPTAAILKIEDKEGRVIDEFKDKEERVLNEEIARKMNDILSDDDARSFIFSRGGKLTLKGRPVCAKTGTTNDNKDGWTMGYTPSLVTGVWVGRNDNKEMKRGADGSIIAAPIWNEFMLKALGDATKPDATPVEIFKKPQPDPVAKVMLDGQSILETKYKFDKTTNKLATDFCPPDYLEERTYAEVHSILYYVDKDNPRGDFPQHPENDPQFEAWEAAVKKWAEGQKDLHLEKPPEDKCPVHNLENKPIINIIYPNNQDTVTSENVEIRINATAPRGINHIDYYFDDALARTVSNFPFNLNYPVNLISNGYHTAKAIAYDDVGNFNEASIELNIMAERKPLTFSWEAPRPNASYYSSVFPIGFKIKLSDPFNVQSLKIVAQREGEDNLELIQSLSAEEMKTDTLEFKWGNNPASGIYHFYAEAIDKKNRSVRSEELILRVL